MSQNKKVIVIGAGPAGVLAAGIASENGYNVLLLEKNDRIGKKLFITGKGRCNLTNARSPKEIVKKIVVNGRFIRNAIYTYDSESVMQFFENLGVKLKVERGGRVFPESDKASDIIKALNKFLRRSGVEIKFGSVVDVKKRGEHFYVSDSNANIYKTEYLVIATGGKSYPITGSTGDGYKFAKQLGHKVIEPKKALVPVIPYDKRLLCLSGLKLKNVGLKLFTNEKKVYEDLGEIEFYSTEIGGATIISSSYYFVSGEKNILEIDFKPALDEKKLNDRLLREFENFKNKNLNWVLRRLLPNDLIGEFVRIGEINQSQKVHSVTKQVRKKIINRLKHFKIEIESLSGWDRAIITSGGISTKEINPKTMESKLISNLYFAGEIIDIAAKTGGYNLQIAFSSGYVAGQLK